MRKKKKHVFHCQQCNSELTIYKKGKKHRVLVCPIHGVIATNPIVHMTALKNLFKSKGNINEAVLGTISDTLSSEFNRTPKSISHAENPSHIHRNGYPLRQKVLDALN